ncbi:MAG: TonB-dependent receptor, partial [Planctomycetales bacterium]
RLGYTFLRGTGGLGVSLVNSPRNQLYLQSSWDMNHDLYFDWIGRYADHRGGIAPTVGAGGPLAAPSYFEMDLRLAWRPLEDVEFYAVGRNLLDGQHLESPAANSGLINTEVPREFYLGVTIRQ